MNGNHLAALLSACLLSAGLAGCGGDGGDGLAPGRIRVFHAVPALAAQSFDIQVNGATLNRGLAYATLSASREVPAGPATVRALNSGTTTEVIASVVTVTSSIDQLLLVTGTPGAAGAEQMRVVNVGRVNLDKSSIPLEGQTRVYFVNAMPKSPAGGVDFSYTPAAGTTQSPAGIQDVGFVSITAEQILGFGDHTFTVNTGAETVNTTTVNLEGRGVYVVILTGNPAASGTAPVLGLHVLRLV